MTSNTSKVSDLIADFLKKKKIKFIFGIIGSANSHIFDSIKKLGYTEIICVHHEQTATMAMQSYYRVKKEITAALVTAGAGSSNAITGVMSAWADSIPGIIISGQENTRFIKSMKKMRMWGIQGYDSTLMVKKITKYQKRILDINSTVYELEKAYNISLEGRPGPVWLDFPIDIQGSSVNKKNLKLYKNKKINFLTKINKASIFKVISESKRPIFWLGLWHRRLPWLLGLLRRPKQRRLLPLWLFYRHPLLHVKPWLCRADLRSRWPDQGPLRTFCFQQWLLPARQVWPCMHLDRP
jgi:acetolactate synthase-1/2/3 large subunit